MTSLRAKDLTFYCCTLPRTLGHRAFIREHHYSKACPPGMFMFGATFDDELVGAMLFRRPSLPRTRVAYSVDLELSRLALLDSAGKNSESRFIGFALRWLRKHTEIDAVVSFADPRQGHKGTIYRASNWEYLGMEKGHGTRRIIVDGEELHSKTAYDRWGCSGAGLIEMLAPRKVQILVCPPKHVYRYALRHRSQK